MAYDFAQTKKYIAGTEEWLSKEYTALRTSRATPALLDGVSVESYGTRMALNQVGSVGSEDARTLRITPWDTSMVKVIEKSVIDANLGVSVSSDGASVRVTFPELTAERRTQLMKLAKEKLEDARISIRKERDRVNQDLQTKEKGGDMSKDDAFRAKEALQKLVDEGNKALEEILKRKEQEISL